MAWWRDRNEEVESQWVSKRLNLCRYKLPTTYHSERWHLWIMAGALPQRAINKSRISVASAKRWFLIGRGRWSRSIQTQRECTWVLVTIAVAGLDNNNTADHVQHPEVPLILPRWITKKVLPEKKHLVCHGHAYGGLSLYLHWFQAGQQ